MPSSKRKSPEGRCPPGSYAALDYEGSIALDPQLMEAADILPFEKVQVLDVNNGARFDTYAKASTVQGIKVFARLALVIAERLRQTDIELEALEER